MYQYFILQKFQRGWIFYLSQKRRPENCFVIGYQPPFLAICCSSGSTICLRLFVIANCVFDSPHITKHISDGVHWFVTHHKHISDDLHWFVTHHETAIGWCALIRHTSPIDIRRCALIRHTSPSRYQMVSTDSSRLTNRYQMVSTDSSHITTHILDDVHWFGTHHNQILDGVHWFGTHHKTDIRWCPYGTLKVIK